MFSGKPRVRELETIPFSSWVNQHKSTISTEPFSIAILTQPEGNYEMDDQKSATMSIDHGTFGYPQLLRV